MGFDFNQFSSVHFPMDPQSVSASCYEMGSVWMRMYVGEKKWNPEVLKWSPLRNHHKMPSKSIKCYISMFRGRYPDESTFSFRVYIHSVSPNCVVPFSSYWELEVSGGSKGEKGSLVALYTLLLFCVSYSSSSLRDLTFSLSASRVSPFSRALNKLGQMLTFSAITLTTYSSPIWVPPEVFPIPHSTRLHFTVAWIESIVLHKKKPLGWKLVRDRWINHRDPVHYASYYLLKDEYSNYPIPLWSHHTI